MNNRHLLGTIKISDSTIFDAHLLFFAIPLVVLLWLFAWRRQFANMVLNSKLRFVQANGALTLGLISLLVFATLIKFSSTSDSIVDTLSFLNNIELVSSVVFAFCLLTRHFNFARFISPFVIVFAAMAVINNPGEKLDTLQVMINLFVISQAGGILLISRRIAKIREIILLSILMFLSLSYMFLINDNSGSNYSTASSELINNNPFYEWIDSPVSKITAFITTALVAQFFIWLAARFVNYKYYGSSKSFVASFKNEVKGERKTLLETSQAMKAELLATDDFESLFGFVNNNNRNKEKVKIEIEEKVKFEFPKTVILPQSVIKNIISKGTRAPSF